MSTKPAKTDKPGETPAPSASDTSSTAPDASSTAPDTSSAPEVKAGGPPPPTPGKRGRGRPPNSSKSNGAANGSSGATPIPGAKPAARGRPPKRVSFDLTELAEQIRALHEILALQTGLAIVQISERESMMLAKGCNAIAEEYGVILHGKTGAIMQLGFAAVLVYAPRYFTIRAAIAQQKAQQAAGTSSDSPPTPPAPPPAAPPDGSPLN